MRVVVLVKVVFLLLCLVFFPLPFFLLLLVSHPAVASSNSPIARSADSHDRPRVRIGHPWDRGQPRCLGLGGARGLLGEQVGVVLRRKRLRLDQEVAEVLLEGAEIAEREHPPAAGLHLRRAQVGEGGGEEERHRGGDEVGVGGPGAARCGVDGADRRRRRSSVACRRRFRRPFPQRRREAPLRRGPRQPEKMVEDAGVELEAGLVEGVGHHGEDLADQVHVVGLFFFFPEQSDV